MAKIEFVGLGEYSKKLFALGRAGLGICKAAAYEGADEVADAVRRSIKSLPAESDYKAIANWRSKTPNAYITEAQKKGLLEGLYLAEMKEEAGFVYTQIGFAGYNDTKTKTYPNGQANSMIARSIESGSSARRKTPFVRPAVNASKEKAIERMGEKVQEMIDKIMD